MNALRFTLGINSGNSIFIVAFVALCGALQTHFSQEGLGTNSLSQNLTVLPAPSGREPLAHPDTLHFSGEQCTMPKAPSQRGLSSECETGGVSSGAPERAAKKPAGQAGFGSVFHPSTLRGEFSTHRVSSSRRVTARRPLAVTRAGSRA